MIEENDSFRRYCRLLGHEVPFSYCREPGTPVFCRHVVDCWWQRFDVKQFLSDHYDSDEIERALRPPTPKMGRLVELIERSRSAD